MSSHMPPWGNPSGPCIAECLNVPVNLNLVSTLLSQNFYINP